MDDKSKLPEVVQGQGLTTPAKYDLLSILKEVHPEHDYKLDEAGQKLLDSFVRLSSIVDTTAIMTCPGGGYCVLAQCGECPLYDAGANLPIGKLCPIEISQYGIKLNNMYEGLKSGDPDYFVSKHELEILQRLVGMEIQLSRVQKEITKNPAAVVETVVGVDSAGNPLTTVVPNPAYTTLGGLRKSIATQQKHLQQVISARQKIVRVRLADEDILKERQKLKEIIEVEGNTSSLLRIHQERQKEKKAKIETQLDKMG